MPMKCLIFAFQQVWEQVINVAHNNDQFRKLLHHRSPRHAGFFSLWTLILYGQTVSFCWKSERMHPPRILKRKNGFLLMLSSCSCTSHTPHRDNGHFQNTENVIHTKKIRAQKASNLLGGHLKIVQVFRESLQSYITIHNQFKSIKFYGQQDIFLTSYVVV